MPRSDYKIIQCVTETSNDLSNLILVGTLFFYDLPTDITDLYGIPIDDQKELGAQTNIKWKWLDIEILAYHFQLADKQFSAYAEDLRFLIKNRFAIASFKVVPLSLSQPIQGYGNTSICSVRIYAIPSDIEGARYFKTFRYNQPRSLFVDKAAKHSWWRLLCYIDFSKESWNFSQEWIQNELFSQIVLLPVCKNKSITVGKVHQSLPDQRVLNFHIKRWMNRERVSRVPTSIAYQKEQSTLVQKLSKIYNSIPSPEFSKLKNLDRPWSNHNNKSVITDPLDVISSLLTHRGSPLKGMKTTLYPFQLNSLTKMFEKETIPEKRLVPYYLELKDIGANTFYFDLNQGSFCSSPELYQLPRGGILAENMGLGKTIITLGLICLTKNDMSAIPEDKIVYSESIAKQRTSLKYLQEIKLNTDASVKRLTELCKNKINQNSLPWKYFSQDLPESVMKILVDNPGSFKMPIDGDISDENNRRKSSLRSRNSIDGDRINYKTLYLCNTTLIFVPENLFHQWNNELKKHVEDDYLNKLFITNQIRHSTASSHSTYTNEIPRDLVRLMEYDVIIISHSFVAKQQKEGTTSIEILKNIYWKRLIIDEGHSTSSKNSKTSLLCKEIESERRWAVTGTPTSGLTRLYMDEDEDVKDMNSSTSKRTKYSVKTAINEKDDLTKLGTIVGSFLNVEPYYTKPKLWAALVSKPLSENKFGAIQGLSNLLNNIVVRHSLSEVDKDLKLPKLHHIPVFLKPSYHNILAINLFTAVLAVNAVSSERTDIDYMFHPTNRQQLRRLITNLQRATFHWTGFKQEDVETLISICQNSLKKHYEKGKVYSDEDVTLLKESMAVAKSALSNSRWRTIALLHEMNYYVTGLPEVYIKNFGTGIMEDDRILNPSVPVGVFGAPHLNAIQEFFYKNRFMDMSNMDLLTNKLTEVSKPFWKSYWGETTKRNMERFNKQDANQEFKVSNDQIENAVQVPEIVLDSSSKKKRKLSDSVNSGHELDLERQEIINHSYVHDSRLSGNSSFDSTRNTEILGTGSAKLSYISSRLLEHQSKNVKSIVFFEFEDSAYYLTESLDVLGVNYILYATFVKPSQRATNLTEFSNYDSGGITLIMDLRLASHGLNIIAATRVYFLSPVWQRSVEAQAIKRAHRIGQMNEVYVETLVLEGTLEEEIYRKRSDDREQEKDDIQGRSITPTPSQSSSTKKYVIDDTGMQEFILRHKFLPQGDEGVEYSPFRSTAVSSTLCKSLDDVPDESSLLDHSDRIVHDVRQWNINLFTNSNLVKLISTKNQKIRKEFEEKDYVRRFIDPDEQLDTEKHLHEIAEKEPQRKKVRF
ncbi:hypothetical protein CLIB1423_21S01486 [[Candida] railenensis]|uniref:Uncharacterized protein n=1 Tax=[Candida] railenensis TaxID=45579 RepID=A0A9P0W0I8_9ASCO|nr:hypothetical protein CLIB1423_21S01486 [[Candida] railenensis]